MPSCAPLVPPSLASILVALSLVVALAGCSSRRSPSAAPADARPAPVQAPAPGADRAGWNDAGIQWRSAEDGLAEARRQKKPVCVVVFTTWCPRCTAYSKLFHDPRLVEASKRFVMIRVDADQDEAVAARFAPDGDYIPRTLFLSPDGELRRDVRARGDQYAYFYDDEDPDPLLAAMQRAEH
jgi:protein-disulfide reductase (glutathione)